MVGATREKPSAVGVGRIKEERSHRIEINRIKFRRRGCQCRWETDTLGRKELFAFWNTNEIVGHSH